MDSAWDQTWLRSAGNSTRSGHFPLSKIMHFRHSTLEPRDSFGCVTKSTSPAYSIWAPSLNLPSSPSSECDSPDSTWHFIFSLNQGTCYYPTIWTKLLWTHFEWEWHAFIQWELSAHKLQLLMEAVREESPVPSLCWGHAMELRA